eukprot:5963973-Pyramimonas_sp.AAC.1
MVAQGMEIFNQATDWAVDEQEPTRAIRLRLASSLCTFPRVCAAPNSKLQGHDIPKRTNGHFNSASLLRRCLNRGSNALFRHVVS